MVEYRNSGWGVFSEGKGDGMGFDWRLKGSARKLADWWGLWSRRWFVVWVEVRDGRQKIYRPKKSTNNTSRPVGTLWVVGRLRIFQ